MSSSLRLLLATFALALASALVAASVAGGAASTRILQAPISVEATRAGDPGVRLSPVRFNPQAGKPGDELRYELTVANTTDAIVRIKPFTIALSGSKDPRAFAEPNPELRSAAAVDWVSYPGFGRDRSIRPGSALRFPVAIKVPAGAKPGTYALGLSVVISVSAPGVSTENATRVQLNVGPVSVAVVRVPGDVLAQARIRDISAPRFVWGGQPRFRVRVENVGDTDLVLDGKVDLSSFIGSAGRTLDAAGPPKGYPTLPGGTRDLHMRWSDPPLVGWFRPELVIVGGTGSDVRITHKLDTVYVLPPWWLVLALVIALYLPLRARRRRARDPRRAEQGRERALGRVEERLRREEAKRRAAEARGRRR